MVAVAIGAINRSTASAVRAASLCASRTLRVRTGTLADNVGSDTSSHFGSTETANIGTQSPLNLPSKKYAEFLPNHFLVLGINFLSHANRSIHGHERFNGW